MEKTIRVLVAATPSGDETKSLLSSKDSGLILKDIDIAKLKSNLKQFTEGISEILPEIPSSGSIRLKQFTAGVELSAEGGVTLVGSLKAGAKASITLTFERE